jgi:hypothetical protein
VNLVQQKGIAADVPIVKRLTRCLRSAGTCRQKLRTGRNFAFRRCAACREYERQKFRNLPIAETLPTFCQRLDLIEDLQSAFLHSKSACLAIGGAHRRFDGAVVCRASGGYNTRERRILSNNVARLGTSLMPAPDQSTFAMRAMWRLADRGRARIAETFSFVAGGAASVDPIAANASKYLRCWTESRF